MLKFDMDFNPIGSNSNDIQTPQLSKRESALAAKMAEANVQHSKNIMLSQSYDALERAGGDNMLYQSEMKILQDMHQRRINR